METIVEQEYVMAVRYSEEYLLAVVVYVYVYNYVVIFTVICMYVCVLFGKEEQASRL